MYRKRTFPWLRIAIHIVGLLPLALIIFDYATNNLTINPIQEIEQRLGRWGVYFLAATLTVTPLYTLIGWRDILKRRRALGLYAFMYIFLHFLVFIGLDYGFFLPQIIDLILGKVYLLVGTLALLLLLPLAVTSFDHFIRSMGKNWRRLHWLIYPAAIASVLHYALAQKGDLFTLRGNILKPFLWGLYIILLFILRLPAVRRWISGMRRKLSTNIRHLTQASKISPG